MKRRLITATILSASLVFAAPLTAMAIEPSGNLSSRIEKLEQELQLLKRQLEVEKEVAKTKQEKIATVELGKKGLTVTSPDKDFSLKLRGTAQIDSRTFLNDRGAGKDEIIARRLRPVLEGTAYKDFSFRLMPDFAGSTTRVFDAHVDYKYSNPLQLRVGKFKTPVSLERLQAPADMFFIERGHPTNLAPSRDFGVQLYGELIPETLEYQLGVFNGNPDLANTDGDDDDKKDVAARIFAHPFRQSDTLALQGLGVGIAGSIGDREGTNGKTILGEYRSPGQQAFFRYRSGTAAADTTYANGRQWRLYPQAYYYYNNMGLLAEYAVSSQEVQRGAISDTLEHKAWQIAASYVLTGEDVNFRGGVKPASPFNPHNDGWGAWEALLRIGGTDIDNNAFPIFADPARSASKAESIGAGLNWYLNENVKLWLGYDFTVFEGGASAGADRPDEQALFSRVQYRF